MAFVNYVPEGTKVLTNPHGVATREGNLIDAGVPKRTGRSGTLFGP